MLYSGFVSDLLLCTRSIGPIEWGGSSAGDTQMLLVMGHPSEPPGRAHDARVGILFLNFPLGTLVLKPQLQHFTFQRIVGGAPALGQDERIGHPHAEPAADQAGQDVRHDNAQTRALAAPDSDFGRGFGSYGRHLISET